MRLEVIRNFLDQRDCDELNRWTETAIEQKWLDSGISKGEPTQTRLTSRMYGSRFVYPQIVSDVSRRIRALFGLEGAPIILGHGRDGVVVSCTFDGGDTYEHRDPRRRDGLATLRCNVLTQKPEAGGVLYIEGAPIDLNVGDLHCYLASEHSHYVSPTVGNVPRVMWMFGAHVRAKDWDQEMIKTKDAV